MDRKLSDLRRIFLGLLLCAVVFSLHFGGEDAQASIRCAYIYSADSTTASDFRSFLLFHGFGCETTLIPSDSISEGANLSYFDLIIVGADTGGLVLDCPTFAEVCFWIPVWPNSSLVVNSGKPVLGLGIGGARFFEQLEGLAVIPYSNIAGFENVQFFYPPNPAHPIFTTPYTVFIDDDTGAIIIYQSLDVLPMVYGAIDPGSGIPPGASLLGEIQVGDASYYPLVQEDTKYFLWGMEGSPSTLTDNSGNLLVNVINYLAKLAPAPAGAPKLDSPTDGMTGVPVVPTMAWNASAGATRYELEIATDPAFIDGVVLRRSGIAGTSYNTGDSEVWLESDTVYYWRVRAENASGTTDWSDVWSFVTEAPYGNLFESIRGIIDPDNDVDGLDDVTMEPFLFTTVGKKTLFVRPTLFVGLSSPQYWADFKNTLFPHPSPATNPGRAYIEALDRAGIEVVIIGDSTNPYVPMQNFNYDPANDPNHYYIDILEVSYYAGSPPNDGPPGPGSHAGGHIYLDLSGAAPTWYWDTKGYTPSAVTKYGYRNARAYELPHKNYFTEGAYTVMNQGTGPVVTTCTAAACTGKFSPINLGGTAAPFGTPDNTVEFNQITFDNLGNITYLPTSLPAQGSDFNKVLRRTVLHEMGHALLEGLDADHCADPNCMMYSGVKDWEGHDFGPGTCVHAPGGSRDVRLRVHNSMPAPTAPTLSSPANGTTGGTTSKTFTWNASTSAGVVSYDLQYSKSSTFPNDATTVTRNGIAATSYAVSGLAGKTMYYWRARAKNNAGVTGSWSGYWTYKTK